MKKSFAIIILLTFAIQALFSQVPKAFKYQAVVRDTSGNVISDQLISLRISILEGTLYGETVYSEIHDVNTNSLGLVNLEIGRGLTISGSFGDIAWGDDESYVKIEVDATGGMNYQILGISQLLAVPYALYAEKAGNQASQDSYWEQGSNGIYYNEGLVGIGTDSPESNMHLVGSSEYTSNRRFLQISNTSIDNLSASILWMNAGQKTSSTFLSHHASTYSLYNGKYAATTQLWNDGNGLYFRIRPESKFLFETYDGGQYSIPVEVMRITGDGKVGIGTENPEFPLEIAGESEYLNGRTFLALRNSATDISSSVDMRLYSGMGDDWMGLFHCGQEYSIFDKYATTSILWNNGNGLILRTKPSGRISFETTVENSDAVIELMRMTGDGKFGIGTENPEAPLQVETESYLEDGRTLLKLINNSTDQFSCASLNLSAGNKSGWGALTHHSDTYTIYGIYANTTVLWNYGNGLILRTNPGGRISFETADQESDAVTEYMRMSSDGKFGIGVLNPQRTLHISDVMRLEPIFTPPENPAEGDIYMDGTDHKLKVFDGTQWRECW